jgi:acetyl esterase/lipase
MDITVAMRAGAAAGTLSVLGLLATVSLALAQGNAAPAVSPTSAYPAPRRIDPIKASDELPLYPNGAPKMPGAAAEERWNAMGESPVVRNVVSPTIRPYLPKPGKANGAAVLVAPGGGFMMLSIKDEGWDVASWLADHGVAAFVLKYRLDPTPADEAAFDKFGRERMAAAFSAGSHASAPVFQPAIDDGVAALKLIQAHATEWHLDSKRLGMIGFSAGAMTTLSVALAQRDGAKPAFIGLIYGPMATVQVPAGAPPLFAALAADDPLFGHAGIGLIDAWHQAGVPAELHLYQRGGHGFGLGMRDTTTRLWPEEFLSWLAMNDLLHSAKP